MLRSLLIYLSQAAWAQKLVTSWGFAWYAASRFVAGESVRDAIRVIRELNEKGINATLDHLGEHTSTTEEAEKATNDILLILDEIEKAGVRANVSIKLTQIGIGLDEAAGGRPAADVPQSVQVVVGLFLGVERLIQQIAVYEYAYVLLNPNEIAGQADYSLNERRFVG